MLECKDLAASAADLASTIMAQSSAVKAMAESMVYEAQMLVHAHASAAATTAAAATSRAAASATEFTSALMARTGSLALVATTRATELTAAAVWRLERTQAWWIKLDRRQQDKLIFASGLSVSVVSIGAAVFYLSRRNATRVLPASGPSEPSEGALSSGAEIVTREQADTVEGREITFDPREEASGQPSLMETSFSDASSSKANSAAPSPDVSFDTETTTDVSVAGEVTLLTYDASSMAGDETFATVDLESAQVRVKELHRLAKALARKRKYLEATGSITEALELLESSDDSPRASALVTSLLNTRSLMYEQAGKLDFALKDCEAIVSAASATPQKARAQKRMARLQRSLPSSSSGEGLPSPSRLSFLKTLTRRTRKSPSKVSSS